MRQLIKNSRSILFILQQNHQYDKPYLSLCHSQQPFSYSRNYSLRFVAKVFANQSKYAFQFKKVAFYDTLCFVGFTISPIMGRDLAKIIMFISRNQQAARHQNWIPRRLLFTEYWR